MFFRRFFVLLLAAVAAARAQEPLNAPAPFAPPRPGTLSAGEIAEQYTAARSAQDMGFNFIAEQRYRTLLKEPGVDHSAVTLALATVLLDDGRAAEAEQVLQADKGPRTAAWHLRAGLAAGQQKKVGQMRAEFDATKPDELPKSDRSWHHFLQVMLTNMETPGGDPGKARRFYEDAIKDATTDFAKLRFELAYEAEKLRTTPASDADIANERDKMERYKGRGPGYDSARLLAVMYDVAGRKNLAVDLLQDQLRAVQDARRLDDFRFLLGLIGGASDGVGRNALIQLLEQGSIASIQRMGLQLLARASDTAATRLQFRALLDRLIDRKPPHQIMDDLLWVRAQVALASKTADGYAQADRDAESLRQQFPKSPLFAHAYWISAQSAWEQARFRIAADNAAKARDALPPGPARAELTVFVAEAWFRAGKLARADGAGGAGGAADFRNASDAYAAALSDPPANLVADLLFQHVLSEIEAGSLDKAQTLLDAAVLNPAFDVRTRWQAEWNLARAFQAAGQTSEAYTRVSRLVAADDAANGTLPPALRAQMAWLQAQLSFDDKPSDDTVKLIDQLDRTLEGLDASMAVDVASSGMLLKARTLFALKRDQAGLEALEALRKKYEKSPAAISSYMVEADHYAQQENVVKAQSLLTKLAEDFPQSEYAPHALFSAALLAKRRGGQENYEEGVRRIEKLIELVDKYPPKNPANDLVFEARMTQGDLLRLLNQFSQAQDTYRSLIENNRQQHAGVIFAQLALAETYNAQSASDPSYSDKAEGLFFQLMVQLDAPLDVRVEAGYNYGEIFARRGDTAKALEIWWDDVVHPFLLKDPKVAARLGTGRFWLARTLLRAGEILEQQQKSEEAKNAWTLIIQSNLGFTEMARQKLARSKGVETPAP